MSDRKSYNLRNESIDDLLTAGLGLEAALVIVAEIIIAAIAFFTGGFGIFIENLKTLGICVVMIIVIAILLVGAEILIHNAMRVKRGKNGLSRNSEIFYPMIVQLLILAGWIALPMALFGIKKYVGPFQLVTKVGFVLACVVIIYHIIVIALKVIAAKSVVSNKELKSLTVYISEDGHTPIRSALNKMKQKGSILFLSFWEYKCLYENYKSLPCKELWIEASNIRYEGLVLDIMDECFEKNIDVYRVEFDKKELTKKERVKRIRMSSDQTENSSTDITDYSTLKGTDDSVSYFNLLSLNREWDFSNTSLAEEMKYKYVAEKLRILGNSKEQSVVFYQLIKLVEYSYHYMALYEMSQNEAARSALTGKTFSSSMGLWKTTMQSKDTTRNKLDKGSAEGNEKLLNAYRIVYKAVKGKTTGVKSVSFDDIASRFVELRNNYIGHGTMAFSVTDELINSMILLAAEIITRFYRSECILEDNKMFEEGIPYVHIEKDDEGRIKGYGLLAGVQHKEGLAEYLDYLNGCFYSNEKITYSLDYEGVPVA
nr:hypothetical protein [uncultured Butyrivibrio sp.]